jgi:hypothetical protein
MGEWMDAERSVCVTSALVRADLAASNPGKRACDSDWVGSRRGLDASDSCKFFTLPEVELRLGRNQLLHRLHYPGASYLLGA